MYKILETIRMDKVQLETLSQHITESILSVLATLPSMGVQPDDSSVPKFRDRVVQHLPSFFDKEKRTSVIIAADIENAYDNYDTTPEEEMLKDGDVFLTREKVFSELQEVKIEIGKWDEAIDDPSQWLDDKLHTDSLENMVILTNRLLNGLSRVLSQRVVFRTFVRQRLNSLREPSTDEEKWETIETIINLYGQT